MPTDGHNAVINNKVPDLSRGDGEGCSGTDPYISAADRFTPAFPQFTFGSAARLISKTWPAIDHSAILSSYSSSGISFINILDKGKAFMYRATP